MFEWPKTVKAEDIKLDTCYFVEFRVGRLARCLVCEINGDYADVLFFDDEGVETIREVPLHHFRFMDECIMRGPAFANVKVLFFITLFKFDLQFLCFRFLNLALEINIFLYFFF